MRALLDWFLSFIRVVYGLAAIAGGVAFLLVIVCLEWIHTDDRA